MGVRRDKLICRILFYLVALGVIMFTSAISYEWYFETWVDNGAEYYDDITGVNKRNHFRSRGRKSTSNGKQGYWVYWRPGLPHETEVVEWFGELKSRKIVTYPGQGKKLKEGVYKNNKMHGFWVFWTKTMQVDRKLTGLYEYNKLIRNARSEFFPLPSAGHPFDKVHTTIHLVVWASLTSILFLIIILWMFSGISKRRQEKKSLLSR
ncbi:hypothetical protein MNBD_GAMMA12-2035 [hydrothermal vent metagenome]|uniref:Uncharacterized protein n=1 Tax=hydrothermal vent metagenome TaxID=652676 RepID=A0A3B0Y6W4_9ZZZZ